jgi:hypothetical protein
MGMNKLIHFTFLFWSPDMSKTQFVPICRCLYVCVREHDNSNWRCPVSVIKTPCSRQASHSRNRHRWNVGTVEPVSRERGTVECGVGTWMNYAPRHRGRCRLHSSPLLLCLHGANHPTPSHDVYYPAWRRATGVCNSWFALAKGSDVFWMGYTWRASR